MINPEPQSDDAIFQAQVQKLHELIVWSRWLTIGLLWITVAPLSLWGLRFEIRLWLDHFTWAAVRYGLAANRLSAVGLGLCIGMLVGVLVWQSRNILFGMSTEYKQRLEERVWQIRKQGTTHPLWKWVVKELKK
ncbi:hypothetical protein ACL6C3_26250 [Capilliphycus salinus ALCB114379]|uniref:hypothetical protein n=1 Tax=Capilliphycus salinus TaxID=2768948 RepID=UPI0039A4ED02